MEVKRARRKVNPKVRWLLVVSKSNALFLRMRAFHSRVLGDAGPLSTAHGKTREKASKQQNTGVEFASRAPIGDTISVGICHVIPLLSFLFLCPG